MLMYRVLFPLFSLLLVSCQTTNPEPSLQSAYPNLAPLVEQVVQAREAQRAAAEQFQATQVRLSHLTSCGCGNLQTLYNATVEEHDAAVQAAVAMSSAIYAIEQTADPLFRQWQIETEVYTDARLKAENQTKLAQTWQSYEGLIQILHQSAAQVDTVLAALNANVVSLQANLNAGAVTARIGELGALENAIGALVQQLNSSMARSDAFVASVQQ